MRKICASIRTCLWAIGTLLAAANCGDGERSNKDGQLLKAKSDENPEITRARKLQSIKVIRKPSNEVDEIADLQAFTQKFLMPTPDDLVEYCATDTVTGGSVEWKFKKATVLAQMAESIASMEVVLERSGRELYEIPPQELPVRAYLMLAARREARNAIGEIFETLGQGFDPSTVWNYMILDWTCLPETTPPAVHYVKMLGVILDFYEEVSKKAAKLAADAGDYLAADAPSLTEGAVWRFNNPFYSRTAAARVLVGGMESGWAGSNDNTPFCSTARLRPAASRALDYFRQAGQNPSDILSAGISTDTLLNGNTSSSVKTRLSQLLHRPELASAASFATAVHLAETDFEEARAYMQKEIQTLRRSMSAVLPASFEGQTWSRYAGTGTEPTSLPPVVWSTLARGRGTAWGPYADGTYVRFDTASIAVSEDPSLSEVTWQVVNGLERVKSACASIYNSMSADMRTYYAPRFTQFNAVANSLQSQRLKSIWGHVDIDRSVSSGSPPGTFAYYLRRPIEGAFSSSPLWVHGEDGLRCAVSGTVEGAPCDISSYKLNSLHGNGFYENFSWTVWEELVTPFVPNQWTTVYLLETPSGRAPRPLAGFVLEFDTSGTLTSQPTSIDIRTEIEEIAAKYVGVDAEWCGQSEYDCQGFLNDERVPFENDLASDNDGVESSWKHYLALAKDAATESHQRGEEHLQAALDFEQRKESNWQLANEAQIRAAAAVDDVQRICGSTMDPREIVKYLPASDPTLEVNCSSGEACIRALTAAAVANKAKDPNMARLAECLDGSKISEFVSPGNKKLCLWVNPSNRNEVCDGADATHPCPVVAPNQGSNDKAVACAGVAVNSSGAEMVLVKDDDLLEYYTPTTSSQATMATKARDACVWIRDLRTGTTKDGKAVDRTATLKKIVDSCFFEYANLASIPSTFGVRLRPRNNIEVRFGGTPLWTTGDVGVTAPSPTATWPCGSSGRPSDCTGSRQGLFCSYTDCASTDSRNTVVSRLRGAVSLARMGKIEPGGIIEAFGSYSGDTIQVPVDSRRSYALGEESFDTCIGKEETGSIAPPGNQPGLTWTECKWERNLGKVQRYLGPVRTHWSHAASTEPLWTWSAGEFASAFPSQVYETMTFYDVLPGNIPDPSVLMLYAGGPHLERWLPPKTDRDKLYGGMAPARLGGEGIAYRMLKEGTVPQDRGPRLFEDSDGDEKLSTLAVLDAMEVVCEALSSRGAGCNGDSLVGGAVGLAGAEAKLKCFADNLEIQVGNMVLAHVPQRARDALRQEGSLGSFPAVGGEIGEAISKLREAFVEFADLPRAIAFEVRQLANDIARVNTQRQMLDAEEDIIGVQATIATLDAVGSMNTGNPYTAVAAVAIGLGKIQMVQQLERMQKRVVDLKIELNVEEFISQFSQRSRTLETYGTRLKQSYEEMDAQLVRIESLRMQAGNKLAEAVRQLEIKAPNSDAIDNVYSWNAHESKRRYDESTKNAIKMAVLARRSIEERLGVHLDQMQTDLPLVNAPPTWINDICRVEGIDFAAIEDGNASVATSDGAPAAFLGHFIGEYVDKLERTVESYRLKFPFSDGQDEAIISVRDDLQKVAKECAVDSPNLIKNAGGIAGSTVAGGLGQGWRLFNCPISPEGVPYSCLGVTQHLPQFSQEGTSMVPFMLDFRYPGRNLPGYPAVSTLHPGVGTTVTLQPGTYYLALRQSGGINGALALAVNHNNAPFTIELRSSHIVTDGPYPVVVWRFTVTEPGDYDVVVQEKTPGSCLNATPVFAGVMLQSVPYSDYTQWTGVSPWTSSDVNGQRSIPVCKDSSGSRFRSQGWERKCLRLCSNGYGESCDVGTGHEECFHELRFHLDDLVLEQGLALQVAGFAKGNYNYRTDKIGLNFIGTGVRSCDSNASPAACNGNATVQYSLEHLGPFYNRSYLGETIESRIFNGRIEHARGLAAERYLTNPLSGADQTLFDPFLRNELQGRPLSGEYVLRVWDSSDVSFEDIEDVQVYLKYRYWTRLN